MMQFPKFKTDSNYCFPNYYFIFFAKLTVVVPVEVELGVVHQARVPLVEAAEAAVARDRVVDGGLATFFLKKEHLVSQSKI